MKKNIVFALGIFFSMVTLFSCGDGGAAEKEAARLDSIKKADSIAAVMMAQHIEDSLAAVAAREAAIADSLAALEASVSGSHHSSSSHTTPKTTTPATTAATTAAATTTQTGKNAIKTTTTTSGKDAIKSTTDANKTGGGKMSIKKGGN